MLSHYRSRDTNGMAVNGLALIHGSSGQYGSAWMAIQQLRVLNALSPREVAQTALRVDASDGRRKDASVRSLVDMRWYDDRINEGLPDDGSGSLDLVDFLRSRALDARIGPLAAVLARSLGKMLMMEPR